MGFIFGSGKKAAKIQANATLEAAELTAASDRLAVQASQQALETGIAQKAAADRAAEILRQPQEQIDVQLAPAVEEATIDESTGRRKTRRSTFQRSTKSSGIQI